MLIFMKSQIIIIIILIIIYLIAINHNISEYFEQDQDIYTISQQKTYDHSIYNKYVDLYFTDFNYKDLSKIVPSKDKKIFISIASYRDPQCSITLMDLLTKTNKPENLVIVICQQNDTADDECINIDKINSLQKTGAEIKLIRLLSKDARGPCWARFLIQQYWSGEQYFLQIDSHTRFVDKWDTICIKNLKQARKNSGNKNICLTNYVSTFNINTNEIEINPLRGPLYIESIDQDDGFFRYNSQYINHMSKPQESIGWSGCFSFSSSKIMIDAPYDPFTPFLFFGEEMDIFARLYTRGWLMYVPKDPVCFTMFDRSYRKTFWEHPDQEKTVYLSKLRLYYKFGLYNPEQAALLPKEIIKQLDNYSLGTKKTFDEFINYCKKK